MRIGRLTPKQEAFCVAVITLDGNASEAYRSVYSTKNMTPKTVNEEASRLLANHKVAARLAELRLPALQAAEVTVERTMREAACLGYFDPGRLYDEAGKMIPVHKLPKDVRAAIAAVDYDKETGRLVRIKFWDKNSALEKLMKHLGLFEKDNRQKTENLAIQINLVGEAQRAPSGVTVQANLVGPNGKPK